MENRVRGRQTKVRSDDVPERPNLRYITALLTAATRRATSCRKEGVDADIWVGLGPLGWVLLDEGRPIRISLEIS